MLHTSYGMGQDYLTNISEPGVFEFTLAMAVLQERIYITDLIALNSWYMCLLQEFLSAVKKTRLPIYTDPIMIGFMNITLVFPHNTTTISYLYPFSNILKLLSIIFIRLSWFHVNLIWHIFYFVIQQLSNIKSIYLLLGGKHVSIYLLVKNLQSLILLLQFQTHQMIISPQHKPIIMQG